MRKLDLAVGPDCCAVRLIGILDRWRCERVSPDASVLADAALTIHFALVLQSVPLAYCSDADV